MANKFGDEKYAMEELVAELTSAYCCAQLNISPIPREDHAQYIANWLQVLKKDKKAIFYASARAQEAVNFLL
jgi:antirestriction protein ArdC